MNKAYLVSALLAMANASQARAATVAVTFRYEKSPLRVELYGVQAGYDDHVAETGVSSTMDEIPATRPLTPKLDLSPSSERSFVLVAHNTGKEPAYFFAVPHVVKPARGSVGLHFECLCTGKIYKVPPGGFWYRIVRLQADKNFAAKTTVELSHSIVGVPAADATGIYRGQLHETALAH